ncbi:MAG: hypothetical protein HFE61_00655 [Anaerotignum sp.]|nr:hypothetical protein [Anaerotignum sp.]
MIGGTHHDNKGTAGKYYDIEMNNVFCYSATYLMDSPKKGYEREWREACESAGILKELIEECD